MFKLKIFFLGLLLSISAFVSAEVTWPYLIGDGMVVQRDTPVKLWGWANPGELITARISDSKNTYKTEADSSGCWSMELHVLKPGGPYWININGKEIKDVLCGDVFLCSGQSNMELPVRRVMDMFAEEVNGYSSKEIRQFVVPQVTSFHGPLDNTAPSRWKDCTPENVMEFSALAYFFAKELNCKTNLPVGIINASWGGTPVEAWISEPTLSAWPEKVSEKKIYEDDGYRDRLKKLEGENYYRWNTRLDTSDPGQNSEQKWYDEYVADGNWEQVDLINDRWGIDKKREINSPVIGSHWLRKHVDLTIEQSSKDAVLRLGCIEGADSAYVNGKFVGTIGYQYPPRIYPVRSDILHSGDNVIAVRVVNGGGEPKVVPEKPYKLITGNGDEISLEGKWAHKTGARMPKGPHMIFWHYTPIVLYDAMISPLFNYPVGGVIWYQGESNVSNRELYFDMLTAMINDWRDGYGKDDVPFYIVELADFLHPTDIGGRQAWSEMRQQQAKVADSDPYSTLIKNRDLGEWNDIHPLDKKTLGIRVADAVMKNKK